MRIPFHQTLRQANKLGFVKTVSLLIAVSLKSLKRIKYLPEKAIINVNNSKMLVLPKKGAIHSELFLYKKREPICTDYLIHSGVIRKNDVVLDVGANIGYYVLVESHLTGNCGKVFAVEPVINNFKLLKKNVKLNNLKNVQSFQLAFGEEDSKSKIYVSDRANLCAMKRSAVGGKIIDVQEVSMLTVDAFFKGKESPNFIRMDVEGYEYEIFRGMPQTLKKNIKILVELHPHLISDKLNEIFQILEQNNFKVQFAVFENKVVENKILRFLMKKAGENLPLIASNMSVQELKCLMAMNPTLSPNVIFEKNVTK